MQFERKEYPRPQFQRKEWIALNGEWEFEFDDNQDGEIRLLHLGKTSLKQRINVPFAYQYEASGVFDEGVHEVVWYKREFSIENLQKRALLCFNGADYITDVWVNGYHVITHTGAYAPFSADITSFLKVGKNTIVVKCFDSLDLSLPRGKQSWTGAPFSCWYIPSTGIWQSVWIEFFGEDCINAYSIVPDIDSGVVYGEIETLYGIADALKIVITKDDKIINSQKVRLHGKTGRYHVDMCEHTTLDKFDYWTPDRPILYHAQFILYKDNKRVDEAQTRFGMRKISIDKDGNVCLNNKLLYQRLILDQGYWRQTGTTPPSVEALKKDIEICKAMGFNGARKHQKVEDPYWYYLADELGFLAWCEMPSAYDFCEREVLSLTKEWGEIVAMAKNFTSVVAYVPLNESWGVRQIPWDKKQQSLANTLYFLTKALDETRPVSTNDGWDNTEFTDFITIHDYARDDSRFQKNYVEGDMEKIYPAGGKLMIPSAKYVGQPILFTEFGGVAMKRNTEKGSWGYGDSAESTESFYERLERLVKGISRCRFQGFCYTQVSDVQQEVNGLLDDVHEPKFSVERLRKIFENK